MKTIFIIDGTSGIWKSDLINYVANCQIKSGIVKKSTTRPKRPEDLQSRNVTELKFMDTEMFDSFNFDFHYSYDGFKYGFLKKEVDDLLAKVDNLFIVIRNLDLIKEFSKIFSRYKIITTFIYTDFDVVSKRIPTANSLQHKKTIEDTFQDYLRHPDVYDEILINGGTVNDFNRLLDMLVTRFTTNQNNEQDFNTSDERTRLFCKRLAARKANTFLAIVVLFCALLWIGYIYITTEYKWDTIEPKFSIITIPILSIGSIFLWFLVTKRQPTLNPKEVHKAIVDHYEKKYIKACCDEV